jgi:NADH dehydrogenase FAD-containing subunit
LHLPLTSLGPGDACSGAGERLPFDVAFLTHGIVPHHLYADSGLPTAPDGGLRVDRHLQAVGLPGVFGGGDCVSLDGSPLPRVGVYAIRQGPVLYRNLLASARGEPLAAFRPQKRYLVILNLGDGTGLVVWGPWVWRGRLGFRWKNHLDTTFMGRFQRCGELQEADMEEAWDS